MKIKITKPVISGGKIMPKDSIHDVDAKIGEQLIEGEFAVEHIEQQRSQKTGRDALMEQYANASKKDLLAAKADAEAKLKENPEYPGAKGAIEVFDELLKKAK